MSCNSCNSNFTPYFDFKKCPSCWEPKPLSGVMDVIWTAKCAAARIGSNYDGLISLCINRQYFTGNDSCGYIPRSDDLEEDHSLDEPFIKHKPLLEEMYKIASEAGCPDPIWLLRW